jgi:predicted MFS family arabinose efflux permease
MPRVISERAIIFLIGAVQFVNILDFVMVMPLGPDFAAGLGIPLSHVGTIGGSYTAAASVAGVVGSYFLDRFDRRKALAVSMLGLVLGTAAGGLATGLPTLLAARVVAGVFGGPATSLSLAIIADVIPVERRGRALGAVMGAFSVASVLGVPAALEVARVGGWRLPFLVVAGLGLVVVAGAIFFLPPVRGHLEPSRQPARPVGVRELLTRREVLFSYGMTAALNMAGFVVIPNISSYLQRNLGYPRKELGLIYLVGGVVSFVTLRVSGKMVDRLGSFRVGTVGSALVLGALYLAFVAPPPGVPLVLIFSCFFLAMGVRNVSHSTLTSRVPEQSIRARFMSFQSAVQHMAAALGAFLSAQLLVDLPDGRLGGLMEMVGVSAALTLALPVLMYQVERLVLAREAHRAPAVALGAGPSSSG